MMTALILGLIAQPALAADAGNLTCKAIYRTVDENNRGIEKSTSMTVEFAAGKVTRYSADLEGRNFSVLEDLSDNSYLSQITAAPDYTRGSVSRAAPDGSGALNLSEVDGFTVYRMECKSKSLTPRLGL